MSPPIPVSPSPRLPVFPPSRLQAYSTVQAATAADPDQILKDFLSGAAAAGNLELETETLFREGTNSTINA